MEGLIIIIFVIGYLLIALEHPIKINKTASPLVGALQSMQTLQHFASWLGDTVGDNRIIVTLIGIVSAIVDNVPLVAAYIGMYSLETCPMDHMILSPKPVGVLV